MRFQQRNREDKDPSKKGWVMDYTQNHDGRPGQKSKRQTVLCLNVDPAVGEFFMVLVVGRAISKRLLCISYKPYEILSKPP